MAEWFYLDGNEKRGPFSAKALDQMYQSGALLDGTNVWTASFGPGWRTIEEAEPVLLAEVRKKSLLKSAANWAFPNRAAAFRGTLLLAAIAALGVGHFWAEGVKSQAAAERKFWDEMLSEAETKVNAGIPATGIDFGNGFVLRAMRHEARALIYQIDAKSISKADLQVALDQQRPALVTLACASQGATLKMGAVFRYDVSTADGGRTSISIGKSDCL